MDSGVFHNLVTGLLSLNTGYILTCVLLLLVAVLLIAAALVKERSLGKYAGVIEINRNDPTKDIMTLHLAVDPDEMKDGDSLIFEVKEHKIKEVR